MSHTAPHFIPYVPYSVSNFLQMYTYNFKMFVFYNWTIKSIEADIKHLTNVKQHVMNLYIYIMLLKNKTDFIWFMFTE